MKTTSYIYLTLAASVALLAGCAKEMDVNVDGASLRFSTNSLEIVSTKAAGEALTGTAAATNRTMNLYSDGKLSDMTLELEESVNTDGLVAATKAAEITSLTTFTVAGFDTSNGSKWFPQSTDFQVVTTGTQYDTYKWVSSKNYQFFGYANLPSSSDVASAAITSSGVTLTYTAVPESATDQEDILLGASYENVPAEGKANMTFYHPLAEVVFKLESSSFGGTSVKVTGITLDGVYKSGTVVCDGNENPNEEEDYFKFTWTDTSSKGTVSQTNASGISISSDVIGVPFMLIPQEFTSGAPLTVNVDLEIDDAAKSFTATLDDITWNSGKKYTYTIKRKSGPDPELWVDLGMVSENGYPLYISKYNVDRIEGGVAYFTDNETDTGLNQYLGSASYTSEDGQPCRTLEISDFWGITSASNTEIESTSNGFLVTSKITGKAVNFPFSDDNCVYCTAFPPFSYNHETNKTYLLRTKDIKAEMLLYPNPTELISKLVFEDTNAEKINLNDFKLYYPQGAIALDWTDYTVSKFIEISNNGTSTWLCNYSMGIMSISCSNGYTLYTSKHVSNYLWTGEKVIDNDWIMIGQDAPSSNESYVTVTHGSQSLKYLVQNWVSCFPKGTLITLADGSRKPVEEISYNDELKVWNFDKGCYDSAKPFWITKVGLRNNCYYKCTFSDGKILNILGLGYTGHQTGHKMYNYTDHFFEGVKTIEVGKEIFTEDGIVTLIGKEEVYEDVEYYCLMTKNHLNCFANGVLTSLRYNNIYPIDDDMKFVKDNRKKRPYKEFKSVGISREWYNDLRLGEQTDSLDIIKEFVDRYDAQTREKPAPTFWQKFRTWWKSIFG